MRPLPVQTRAQKAAEIERLLGEVITREDANDIFWRRVEAARVAGASWAEIAKPAGYVSARTIRRSYNQRLAVNYNEEDEL